VHAEARDGEGYSGSAVAREGKTLARIGIFGGCRWVIYIGKSNTILNFHWQCGTKDFHFPILSWAFEILCGIAENSLGQAQIPIKVRSISALLKAEILQLNEICRENIEIL
jgi:hypothetical protein